MIKYGVLTTESHSDFDLTKKADYFDAEGTDVADENNKHKLNKPIKIEESPIKED